MQITESASAIALQVCLDRKVTEVFMSSPQDEFTFAKEFVGNLRGKSEPVPVRVNTSLRVMTEETVREFQEYIRPGGVSLYISGLGKELPLHPILQAMGRHYFSW
jgi:hypothetical protein